MVELEKEGRGDEETRARGERARLVYQTQR